MLQFRAAPAAMQLSDALDTVRDMYRKQLRKVPPSAPIGFIPESWRKVVITPTGIDRKYYEFCVLNELKGALRSGDIWVKGSRRYRNFDDYLIPSDDFEKSLRDNQLPLAVPADCHEYIKSRLTLLASRLEEVNAMALAGDLPDVDISDKGVKITPLDNSVPSAASPFGDLVYGMLPHPKITEMLDEVDGWTGFTRHFTHLKNNHVRPKDRKLLLTTILADGINLGLTKMAESCPGTTKSSLEGIQAWYIRDETYSAALAELVNAQKKALWRHSGAMEQRHRLMDRTFGWGVTGVMLVRSILNTVRIQACRFIRIFRTNTARFTPKLSAACGIQHTYLMVCCTTKLIWKLQSITPTQQVSLSMFLR